MRVPDFPFVTLTRFLSLIVAQILALMLCAMPAAAQGLPGTGVHIHPQLLAESGNPAPGSMVTLAIVMRPAPGWHGYWVNPGDAGLGVDARWTVPEGAVVGPLRYPAPERLLVSGLMNHVFDGPYALLADLRVPAGLKPGDPLPVALDARWLACTDKVCVPEQARLSLDLVMGKGVIAADNRSRFDDYRAALPRPLGSEARYAVADGGIRIAIPYPAAAPVETPWFYTTARDRVVHAESQSARRVGEMLVIETKTQADAPATGVLEGVLTVAPGTSLSLSAHPGPVPSGGQVIGRAAEGAGFTTAAFLLALGGALLGGLVLNIMPCVFPILSLKAISLARAGGDERAARREALAYTVGALLSCVALGGIILALRAAGTSVGWAFQLQDNRVIALLLVLTVAITANLAGLFALPALDGGRQGKGAGGAFLTGVLAAFVATPCTGPFMAAAMGAAILMPPPLALTVFAGLGLGLASPFLLLAFVPPLRRRLPKPGPWMERLRRIMAVPMALTILALGWLLWRQGGQAGIALATTLGLATMVLSILIGGLQRRGAAVLVPALAGVALLVVGAALSARLLPAERTTETVEGALPFSEAKLAELRAAKRPLFLYFTADWCVTCKVNEAGAITDGAVMRRFAGKDVAIMVGDWTKGDPAITRFLEAQGRSGVPLYLYYAPGAEGPRILPQILTPAMLLALTEG